MTKSLSYRVKTGEKAGAIFTPHPHPKHDGQYLVSKTNLIADAIKVKTLEEVYEYFKKGMRVRMSDPRDRDAPSLISPCSITVS